MKNPDEKLLTDLLSPSMETMIFQPIVTAGMREFADITRMYRSSESYQPEIERCVWELIHSVMESNRFVHVGEINHSKHSHDPLVYGYCGGFCEATPNQRGELGWECDKCQAVMRFHHVRHEDVPDVLLHLLIKQMVPSLRSANYLWTPETGVVGVLHDALTYKMRAHHTTGFRANFGFVFMPGMQTLQASSGFEEWLRFLVQIKFDQLKAKADWQLSGLIGPEHFGSLNSGLRFWRR